MKALLLGFVIATIVLSCSGTKTRSGVDEPILVRNGTFREGQFPLGPTAPTITTIETASSVIRPGELEKSIAGRASNDAFAVGLRFPGLGTGYWVVPVSAPDPQFNSERGWTTTDDFAANLPTGPNVLDIVAFDGNGNAGPVNELSLCVATAVPDNLNVCNDKVAPPAAVFSLTWDTPVDLDLVVVTPDGRVVDAKHPLTVAPPAPGPDVDSSVPANTGAFDRDSNANCVIDGNQREDLVFQQRPSAGSWLVYASLFDACGQQIVHFDFTLWEAAADPADPTAQHLQASITKSGFMLPIEASGGATLGTFVTEIPY